MASSEKQQILRLKSDYLAGIPLHRSVEAVGGPLAVQERLIMLGCFALLTNPALSAEQEQEIREILEKRTPIEDALEEMCVIPAGSFLYGDAQKSKLAAAFAIGKYPVTMRLYAAFLSANPTYPVPYIAQPWARPWNWNPQKRLYPKGMGNFPVVLVSYADAQAFCRWANKRLPSQIEWEKAARGTDGRLYPWGNQWNASYANTRESGLRCSTPVTWYREVTSPYQVCDLLGNVWEWTESTVARGVGLRGGSFAGSALHAQVTFKNSIFAEARSTAIGFRVAE